MSYLKKLTCLVLFTGLILSAKAQSPATSDHEKPLRVIKKPITTSGHYLSIAYELETGSGPRNGISFQYLGSVSARRRYYVGVKTGLLSEKSEVSFYKYSLHALSLELSQRFIISQSKKVLPFIDFDLGYRFVNNYAEVPITYGGPAPGIWGPLGFRSITGGDTTDNLSYNSFSGHVGVGCFINLGKGNGFFARLGYRFTDAVQLIDKNSLGSTSNHSSADHTIGYNTYASVPSFVTFSIGATIGKIR